MVMQKIYIKMPIDESTWAQLYQNIFCILVLAFVCTASRVFWKEDLGGKGRSCSVFLKQLPITFAVE